MPAVLSWLDENLSRKGFLAKAGTARQPVSLGWPPRDREPARAPAAVELGILSPAPAPIRRCAASSSLELGRPVAVDGTECGPPHRPPSPASAAAAGRAFRRAFTGLGWRSPHRRALLHLRGLAEAVVVDRVRPQEDDLVDLSAPDREDERVVRVPPQVEVERVPAPGKELPPLAPCRLRGGHADAGAVARHEAPRGGLEVRQLPGRVADRVDG